MTSSDIDNPVSSSPGGAYTTAYEDPNGEIAAEEEVDIYNLACTCYLLGCAGVIFVAVSPRNSRDQLPNVCILNM